MGSSTQYCIFKRTFLISVISQSSCSSAIRINSCATVVEHTRIGEKEELISFWSGRVVSLGKKGGGGGGK